MSFPRQHWALSHPPLSLHVARASMSTPSETETCTRVISALLCHTVQHLRHNWVVSSRHVLNWGGNEEGDNLARNKKVFLAIKQNKGTKNPTQPEPLWKCFPILQNKQKNTLQSYLVILLPNQAQLLLEYWTKRKRGH